MVLTVDPDDGQSFGLVVAVLGDWAGRRGMAGTSGVRKVVPVLLILDFRAALPTAGG